MKNEEYIKKILRLKLEDKVKKDLRLGRLTSAKRINGEYDY